MEGKSTTTSAVSSSQNKINFVVDAGTDPVHTTHMNVTSGLFHKELGLPSATQQLLGRVRLSYSRHAQLAAINDRYGRVERPPMALEVRLGDVVEVELQNGQAVKATSCWSSTPPWAAPPWSAPSGST